METGCIVLTFEFDSENLWFCHSNKPCQQYFGIVVRSQFFKNWMKFCLDLILAVWRHKRVLCRGLLFSPLLTYLCRVCTVLKSPWILRRVLKKSCNSIFLERSFNFRASPWKVLEFSSTYVVARKVFFNAFCLSNINI